MQFNRSLRRVTLAFPIALVALLVTLPAGAQTYSLNPVPPNYIEANTEYPLPPGEVDDGILEVPLPFPFTFYGVTYDSGQLIYVSTNGYINFLMGNSSFQNFCLPDPATPNGAIYAFWDDLVVDDSASMRTELLEANTPPTNPDPYRKFVIEWRNVHFFGDETRRIDFEIVLHETGAILLQYRNIDNDSREMGISATIGLENQPGAEAAQYSYSINSTDNPNPICLNNFRAIGPGEFALGTSVVATPRTVAVDIKPGGCPNPINVGSKGVLPVAILGTADFDVTTIDPATITLAGVVPLRWSLEDAGTPHERLLGEADPYDCNSFGPDGYLDMAFKFDSEAITKALGPVNDGDTLFLEVRGQLKDGNGTGNGTPISGQDVVTMIRKGK